MAATAPVAPGRMASPTARRPFLVRGARKWWRIFSVFAQDALAYRAVAVIWILTDAIPALVMPLIWLAAFNGRAEIAGFAPSQITAYYLVLLFITNLVQCHQMWEMAQDIKEGRFSSYLIRPFSYGTMNYLSFLAWRIMRTALFLPIFAVAVYLFRGNLQWQDYYLGWPFFASVALGHLVSFFISYAMGLLALHFVETRSLFNFWYMPLLVFSGQVAPLAMFPPTVQRIAEVLPFRYTVALPTEIFLGRLSPSQMQQGLLWQLAWIGIAYVIGWLLWRTGVKRFTGVGL